MKRLSLLFLALAAGAHGADTPAGGTIVQRRIAETTRLVPLAKLTVGPDDQYQGAVDPTGRFLVFTRKSDLVPHLCRQNLATGEVTDLIDVSSDSQQPAFGPDGTIAFTYYKFNARGDICYQKEPGARGSRIVCLKDDAGERSSPFWKSARELGYVVRDVRTLNARVVVENLDTGARETLAEGKIWSPAMAIGGHTLYYNELVENDGGEPRRMLVRKDLKSGKTKTLRFSLPGISGFPSIPEDEKYVYFSHYLNDTNHDNVIDGDDNAVIFRIPAEGLPESGVVFPEQLTSAETNCSFPRPFGDDLFVTCAFEGSLDLYRIPVTGVVPKGWDEKILANAHQTARSYSDRILLLNTMKYRLGKVNDTAYTERLLSDHVLADDTSAVRYYLNELRAAKPASRGFYDLLLLYVEAREKKNEQRSDEVTRSFERDILAIDARVQKAAGPARLRTILRGLLRTYLNQPRESLGFLKQVQFDQPGHPMERFLFFELASWTLPRVDDRKGLARIYRDMMRAPELTHESRLYYGFHFLQDVQTSGKTPAERIPMVQAIDHGLPEPVSQLLKAEVATLGIILAPDDGAKTRAYPELDKYLSASREDYFLRKAMYVRSILNFAEAAEFKFLGFIATNWLRYTDKADAEFSYAREVVINASLDQAYDNYAREMYQLAGNYFYGSLSLTDDLESHYGYLRSMLKQDKRTTIDERYQNLKTREFIDDNMKFVEAVLGLMDARPGPRDTGPFDRAMDRLKAMQQDRDSSVRYLLLGYCELEKLQRTANGSDLDQGLLADAHRNLMLAYDIGRDNDRVKASALLNLGVLHARAKNHGLAAKFFSRRAALGFLSDEERVRIAWLRARSLFYTYLPDKAAEELTTVLRLAASGKLVLPAGWESPLKERRAFYLQAAGSYGEAVAAYRELFEKRRIAGDLNLAKANLGYGYSLFKRNAEGDAATARATLRQAAAFAERLPVVKQGGDRLVDFEPLRLQLNAWGLLSRLGTPDERIAALEKRKALLLGAKAMYDDWTSLRIQNGLQLAALVTEKDPARAQRELREALALAEGLGDSGQWMSHAVYRATTAYLAHGVRHPELYRQESTERSKKLVDKTLEAYGKQKQAEGALAFQKVKLQMLWAAYSAKVTKGPGADPREIRKLVETSSVKSEALDELADALSR